MNKLLIVIGVFLLSIGISYVWWQRGLSPVNSTDKTPHIFVIKPGQGVKETANQLKKENLIKDSVVFFLLVKQLGIDGKIQAGDFRLTPSMTAHQVAEELTHGTIDIWVTIPEGKRAQEIADILKAAIPSYQESWREALTENEGYLFPDTYLIPRDADITMIVTLLKGTFDKKYEEVSGPGKSQLSKREIVTIASMVEREAQRAQDRPLVASVILNRLSIGMKLDIDATIQYALGFQKNEKRWWKKALTFEDLRLNSPYNTYLTNSLPPTPISNPGLNALQAVVNAPETDYLFYISDSSGNNHYATSLEEHNANIKKYGL